MKSNECFLRAGKVVAMGIALASSVTASAGGYGEYSINITNVRPTKQLPGTEGWDCRVSIEVGYLEYLRDHRGKVVSRPMNEVHQGRHSLLDNPSAYTTFRRELFPEDGEGKTEFFLRERCTKSEVTMRTYFDFDDNSSHIEPVTETKTEEIIYLCEGSVLPKKIGHSKKLNCEVADSKSDTSEFRTSSLTRPLNVGFTWSQIGKSPLKKIYGHQFVAEVKLLDAKEEYTKQICSAGKRRVVIRLDQGVWGKSGEDDFAFDVQLDGGVPFRIKRNSGLLKDDILFCTSNDTVDVKVFPTELDAFHNDVYKPMVQKGVKVAVGGEAFLDYKRNLWFGRSNSESQIRVRVLPYTDVKSDLERRSNVTQPETHR